MCLAGLVNFKPEDKHMTDHGHLYDSFVGRASLFAVFLTGIALTKALADHFNYDNLYSEGIYMPLFSIAVSVICFAIIYLQTFILRAATAITLSSALADHIIALKKGDIAAAAILSTIPTLFWVGAEGIWQIVFAYIAVGEIIAIIIIFLVKTLALFIRQKISILLWILYICTVEIFPLSLAILLVAKIL
jgi:hypothetical protein